VVSSEHEEVLWVLDLVGEHEADGLHALLASIHVVTDEQEFLIRTRPPSNLKKPEQIEILPMHITKNFHWSLDFNKHIFLGEYLTSLVNKEFNSLWIKFDRLSPLSIFNFDKLIYNHI